MKAAFTGKNTHEMNKNIILEGRCEQISKFNVQNTQHRMTTEKKIIINIDNKINKNKGVK